MQFDQNSALVKMFASLVRSGKYAIDTVPNIENLRQEVQSALQS